MRILRYDELSIPSPCPTFRNKSWLALLALGVLMAAIAVYVATPKVRPGSPVLALFPALLAGFLLLLCLERLRICSKPTAWLLRVVEDGLYVNLRTFHNYQLGRDTHRVLFIPTDAIAAVCKTHETRLVPGRRGAHKDQYSYVDILLKHGDLGPLQAALREERRLKPPRGWFARRKRHDYPVRVLEPPGVRLVWDWIKPNEDRALDVLGRQCPVGPEQKARPKTWEKLSSEEREDLIWQFWEWGYLEDAIRMGSMHWGLGAFRARKRLEAGRGGEWGTVGNGQTD